MVGQGVDGRPLAGRRSTVGLDNHRSTETVGRGADARVTDEQAIDEPGITRRVGGDVTDESLSGERPAGTDLTGRQGDLVLDESVVDGRTADLDDFQAGRTAKNTMTDLRRLEHAVAGVQAERITLVLVDDVDPATRAEDQLEADPVEVHVVRNRSAITNQYV